MELWLAVLLLVIVIAGVVMFLFYMQKKPNKRYFIIGICALGIVLFILATYIVLAFLFLDTISSETPPPDRLEITEPTVSPDKSPLIFVEALSEPTHTYPLEPSAMPDEFDLPISEVSELYPDILGIRDRKYGDMPTFATINEASAYVLHNILNKQYEMEFYLERELVPDEGSGYVLLCAFENAQSYFPFGAYSTYDAYTEDCGEQDKVLARLKLEYAGEEELDKEARSEALEFVMKNPLPYGGFTTFEDERAYTLKIHDFIARKITYSPIGYSIMEHLSKDSYEMKQEAYNVLGESQEDAVCAAYARAFAMICHYAGINTTWVRGNEIDDESHAWNMVFPCDKSAPVLVDVTWDDTDSGDDRVGQVNISYSYFYLPIEEDYQHTPMELIEDFILYINRL